MKKISLLAVLVLLPALSTISLSGLCNPLEKLTSVKGYPFLELWNKDPKPIYYHITQDKNDFNSKGLTPAKLAPQARISGWTVAENQRITRIYNNKPFSMLPYKIDSGKEKQIYIGLYENGSAQQQPKKVLRAPVSHTVYLTWQSPRGLYPQTGPLKGLSSTTESCLDRTNNLKENELQDVTAQIKEAVQKKQEPVSKAPQKKTQAVAQASQKAGSAATKPVGAVVNGCLEKYNAFKEVVLALLDEAKISGHNAQLAAKVFNTHKNKFVKECNLGKCDTEFKNLMQLYESIIDMAGKIASLKESGLGYVALQKTKNNIILQGNAKNKEVKECLQKHQA